MIRLSIIKDFGKDSSKVECPGPDAAAQAVKHFTKEPRGIIARIDTDDELIALDVEVEARNAKSMERAAKTQVGQVVVTAWVRTGRYVDGAGWRVTFAPQELEGHPDPRAAGAARNGPPVLGRG